MISSRALGIALTVAFCMALFESVSGTYTKNPPPGSRWNEYGWPATFLTRLYTTTQNRKWRRANASVHDISAVCPAELPLRGGEWKSLRPHLLALDFAVCVAIVVVTALGAELALRARGASRKLTIRAILLHSGVIAAFAGFTRSTLLSHARCYYFEFRPVLIVASIVVSLLFVVWLWAAFTNSRIPGTANR